MTTAEKVLIAIAFCQAVQTLVMSMGAFILSDMRQRIKRLEDIEMGRHGRKATQV